MLSEKQITELSDEAIKLAQIAHQAFIHAAQNKSEDTMKWAIEADRQNERAKVYHQILLGESDNT